MSQVTFGDIATKSIDKSGPSAGAFLYVDISSVDREAKRITEPKQLESDQAPSRAKQRLRAGDVLVSMTRPNLNAVALVTSDLDGSIGSTGFHVIRSDVVEPKFIYYLVQTRDFVEKMCEKVQGALYPAVRPSDINSYNFLLPPTIEEQRQIVDKIDALLSELDKGIESLKTAREQLKVYRQAVLKHAFEGKLTAQWREEKKDKLESPEQLIARIQHEREARYQQKLKEWKAAVKAWEAGGKEGKKPGKPNKLPAATLLSKSELEELTTLPYGWCWLKVGVLSDVVRGGSPRPAGDSRFYDGDIPFLKVADLTRTDGCYITNHTYTIKPAGLQKTRLVEPNTLLISNSGATLGVPKICLINATFNDGIAAFLGLSRDELPYHYYFWSSKTHELRAINQGAAQPNLNTDLIKDIAIPVCSSDEMSEVTERIEKSLSTTDHFLAEIDEAVKKAESLRQAILKKAFSGEFLGGK